MINLISIVMILITFINPNNHNAVKQSGQSETIHDAAAGFSLQLPDGWVYQAGAGGIIAGHNTIPGMILIGPVSAGNLDELSNEIQMSLQQQASEDLMLYPESIQTRDEQTIVVTVQGQTGFQPVSGYSVNLISPYGGEGLSISALVLSELYDESYPDFVEQITASVRFFEPEKSETVQHWENRLAGRKLTYRSSHYGSGGGNDGYNTGGGWEERSEFHLCNNGTVHGSSSSSVSVDTGGAFGQSHGGSGQMQGTWKIRAFAGHPAIEAKFSDGTIYRLPLAEQNGNTYLGGQQWFITNDARCM